MNLTTEQLALLQRLGTTDNLPLADVNLSVAHDLHVLKLAFMTSPKMDGAHLNITYAGRRLLAQLDKNL